ncbi:peptidase T [Enterococcus italicus]|uniref:peptidase T n=2 Tax=Enterococcus italicus TaxID=246144 RepID=UPI002073FDCE|nr:peptidase T [Enterococcus italicus]MCM6932219.1 peptidase T [Enterococcus italicus]
MVHSITERFIRYAKLDTRSDASSHTVPTTRGQIDFAELLAEELPAFGVESITHNRENGFVTAVLKGNPEKTAVGFIAHLDTADFASEHIQPQVHENYDGQDVVLNKEKDIVMTVAEFPNLTDYVGQTLITTDGTTLLGVDDKAGIVEILHMLEQIKQWPKEQRGDVWVAFGPDEEIGRGADLFDVANFPVAYAYTIDSGRLGHFEYETFNAAEAKLTIEGTSVHPGTAYGRLVNALKIANAIEQKLPAEDVPERTREREGFYLLNHLNGSIGQAEMTYIIRDHDHELFEARKQALYTIVEEINATLDRPRIAITMHDQYYNMRDIIDKDPRAVDVALEAIRAVGLEPIVSPFRGGTDGSKISYMGIPTPNIFTGGENFHGQYEFVTEEAMLKVSETLVKIVELSGR